MMCCLLTDDLLVGTLLYLPKITIQMIQLHELIHECSKIVFGVARMILQIAKIHAQQVSEAFKLWMILPIRTRAPLLIINTLSRHHHNSLQQQWENLQFIIYDIPFFKNCTRCQYYLRFPWDTAPVASAVAFRANTTHLSSPIFVRDAEKISLTSSHANAVISAEPSAGDSHLAETTIIQEKHQTTAHWAIPTM